jgi:hypothetical protein
MGRDWLAPPTAHTAHAHPDQHAALRRLRAAFGFIQVLRIVDHDVGHKDDDDPIEDGSQAPSADR